MISWQTPLDRTAREQRLMQIRAEDLIESEWEKETIVWPHWALSNFPRNKRVIILHSTSDGTGSNYSDGGKAGIVRTTLAKAGISIDRIAELGVVYQSIVGTPTKEQVLENRHLMRACLDAADADWVLLHGAHALHTWRPDLMLKQYQGRLGLWDKRWWVMPIYQIDGVVNNRGEVSLVDWQRQITQFAEIIESPDPMKYVEGSCVYRTKQGLCEVRADHWDWDAVPWCMKHWKEAEDKERTTRNREAKAIRNRMQPSLLDEVIE